MRKSAAGYHPETSRSVDSAVRPVWALCVLLVVSALAADNARGDNAAAALDPDISALVQQMRSVTVREDAYAVLSDLVTVDDLDVLHRALQEETQTTVRWRLARLIGHVGSRRSQDVLRTVLLHDDAKGVRAQAAWALGRAGKSRAAIADLNHAMQSDPEVCVRKGAAEALRTMLGPDAVPLFESALAFEEEPGVRLTLQWFLDVDFQKTRAPEVVPGQATYGSYAGTLYVLYVPTAYRRTRKAKLLVSVHGTDGTPEAYADLWRADAERFGLVVLAPFFDATTFPNYDLLNIGLDTLRSDRRLLDIIRAVARRVNIDRSRFWLFGHSKGGQFVTRFVLAHPDRIARAAACGSGNYVMPNPGTLFPVGTKPHPFALDLTPLDFARLVEIPLAVVVGDRDLDRRKDAAHSFIQAVRAYAERHRVPCNVEFFSVHEGGHSGTSNYPTASMFLFEGM